MLVKLVAARRWPADAPAGFQCAAEDIEHEWIYRGQVLPTDGQVTVQATVTEIDDARRLIRAAGFLAVDSRNIYQMNDFTVRIPRYSP